MNLEDIKARLKSLEKGANKSKKWKPKDEHTVRLLPLQNEVVDDLAFYVKWHYGVNNGVQIACPKTWDMQCPFCDFADKLKSFKDEHGQNKTKTAKDLDWQLYKKIECGTRFYAPIVVRKFNSEKKQTGEVDGPFLWEMSEKSYTKLLLICAKDDLNEDHPEGGALKILTSLKYGHDLTVSLKKAGQGDNKTSYDLTEIDFRLKKTVLLSDSDAVNNLLQTKMSIEDITKVVSTEDMNKVFEAWKNSMQDVSTDSSSKEYNADGETVGYGDATVSEIQSKLESLMTK